MTNRIFIIKSTKKKEKIRYHIVFLYTNSCSYMFTLVSVVNICTYIYLHMFPLISTTPLKGLRVLMKDKKKEERKKSAKV